jgi:hypothetical protein
MGARPSLKDFERRAQRTYRRELDGEVWDENIPLSFVALHLVTPVFPDDEEPSEALDLRAWRLKRLSAKRYELRYQFHTRNMEAIPVFRVIGPNFPRLVFRLVTLCLDDMSYESWQVHGKRATKREVPEQRLRRLEMAAMRRFDLPEDQVYMSDDSDHWIMERMFEEAFGLWQPRGRPYRRNWWNAPEHCSLEDERVISMARIADDLAGMERQSRPPQSRTRKSTSGRERSGGVGQ